MSLLKRSELGAVSSVVVKVGSKILAPQDDGDHLVRISRLTNHIALLVKAGHMVVFVSSGAVAHGRVRLGMSSRPSSIPLKQACAGVGQIELMSLYRDAFEKEGFSCGQVLLTWDDLRDKQRYFNLRNTLIAMLENNIIPIINENDSVGVDEIRFGDNDTLAAQIAMVVNADLFITLSDINGLYTANPRSDSSATHIPVVEKCTDAIRAMADGEGSDVGTGGMITKIRAAEMVTRAGIYAVVGDGYNNDLLDVINDPKNSTLFISQRNKMNSKKRFLAFTDAPTGTVDVDEGAYNAVLTRGKSLLPAGVTSITPGVCDGDTVKIAYKGSVFAKGIINYGSENIELIKGHSTTEISKILGSCPYDEVIHRDNLVLI